MKNGMQMLLESILPADTLAAIQKAASDLPEIAKRVGAQLDRMEQTLLHVEAITERIENKVRGDNPPEETPLSQLALGTSQNKLPPSLERMLDSDG